MEEGGIETISHVSSMADWELMGEDKESRQPSSFQKYKHLVQPGGDRQKPGLRCQGMGEVE